MAVVDHVAPLSTADLPRLAEHVAVGIAMGFAGSQILFTAAELGIFELLKDGSQKLETLAGNAGVQQRPLERLLIGCCALGLLAREDKSFRLTDLSRSCLLKNSPAYVGGMFPFLKRALYPVWEHLDAALHEGAPQWQKVPSIGQSGLFEALYRDPRSLREFHEATYQLSYLTSIMACRSFDFSRFRTVVDIGGGTGGFVAGVCQNFPNVRGVVFDLAALESLALETFARTGLGDRIRFVGGNFFQDSLPSGDLYILGDILHDWTTIQGAEILKKVCQALPNHGAVVIAESMLNDHKDGPHLPAVMNLTTLLTTNGEHHSPAEFESWLSSIGFARFQHWFFPGCPRDLFVGWKE